jgi:PAS domain S-box-containing protein
MTKKYKTREELIEALRLSEEKLMKIVNMLPIPITISDAETGIFLDINKAGLKMYGYRKDEIWGHSSVELGIITPDDRKRLMDEVKRKGHAHNWEVTFRTKAGDIRHNRLYVELLNLAKRPCLLAAALDISKRKVAEEQILGYQKQLKALASLLSSAEEQERRRIAGEMHDHISHTLALAKIKLGALQASGFSRSTEKDMKEISGLIDETIVRTRTLIFDLSPPVLYELGFVSAVDWLVEKFRKQYGLTIEFIHDIYLNPPDSDIRIMLFKSLRELLRNVVKHAHVKKAKLSIRTTGPDIQVKVEDRGKGFDASKAFSIIDKDSGFGLFNIRERLEYLGGKLKVESEPGHGTRVILTVPLTNAGNPGKGACHEH